jgi:septal ring factor EnvC (AmiA/AmiB activator)
MSERGNLYRTALAQQNALVSELNKLRKENGELRDSVARLEEELQTEVRNAAWEAERAQNAVEEAEALRKNFAVSPSSPPK